MLDKFMVRNRLQGDIFSQEYTPDQAITDRKLVNSEGQNLSVLFPPWHGGGVPYEKLIKRLTNKGNAVLAYYFHDEILKPDVDLVAESYAYAKETIADDLETIRKSNDYLRINLIATSLGNAAFAAVSGRFTDFDSATIFVSGSSLAKSMWHGSRTQHIRTGIEQKGYDLADVEAAWYDMAPINHLDALVGKEVTMIASLTDELIPSRYQRELVDVTRAADINPTIRYTRLGHYATVGKAWLYDNV